MELLWHVLRRVHGNLVRLSQSTTLSAIGSAILTLLFYCLFSAVFFTNVEGWTTVEAIYFSMVTMSTVGYGDLAPTIWYSQMVGVAFILVGIILVFGQIGGVVGFAIEPLFDHTRELTNSIFPPVYLQITDETGHHKIRAPRRPAIFYTKALIGPIVILLLFQFISAALFVWVEPDWDLRTALWYVMVTATTVGYGDVSVSTSNDWGLIWASLHILLSVSLLAALIEDITKQKQERVNLLTQVYQFKKCHEKDTLKSLDLDGSGELNEQEFVLGMLEKIGKLDHQKDVLPIKMLFDGIDKNKDGKVNINKLETHEGTMRAKLRKLDGYVQQEILYMEVKEAQQKEKEKDDTMQRSRVSPEPPPPVPRPPPTPRDNGIPPPPPYPPPPYQPPLTAQPHQPPASGISTQGGVNNIYCYVTW